VHPKSDNQPDSGDDAASLIKAGELAEELGVSIEVMKWCLQATAHIHRSSTSSRLHPDFRLNQFEVAAVRHCFGSLPAGEIEAQHAEFVRRAAEDEATSLISGPEAASRCGVAESTIRGWVHRGKLSPVEYAYGMAWYRQIDVQLANQASKAKAAVVSRRPEPRSMDRNEALNQLTMAVAACMEAGLTDIPGLVQKILDSAKPVQDHPET
jgi:hypothetical protein